MAEPDPAPAATPGLRSGAWRAASLVLGLGAVGFAIWLVVGDDAALDAIGTIDASSMFVVLGLLTLGTIGGSFYFRLVLPSRVRRRIDTWSWHHLFAVGRLLNLGVPQAGMAYRAARLRIGHRIPVSTFVGSLAVVNWLSSGVAAAMAGCVLLAAGAVVAGSAVLAIGLMMVIGLAAASRLQIKRWSLPSRAAAIVARFGESFRELAAARSSLVRVVVASLASQAFIAAGHVAVCAALDVPDPLVVGTVLYAGSAVVSVVTLTPGSLGITELVSAAAGSALDVGAGLGVVVALVIRVLVAGAVGLLALVATAAGGSARSTAARAARRDRSARGLRVLHVASSYPFDDDDPTAPFMAEMLGAIAAAGIDVTVVVPDAPGMVAGDRGGVRVVAYRFPFWRRRVWGHGSSQRSSGRIRLAAFLAAPVALLSMARVVRRQIRQTHPDVVHLHWLIPQGVLALVVPRSIPVILSVHGAGVRLATRRRLVRLVARWSLTRIDHVVAPSRPILDRLTSIDPGVPGRASLLEHGAGDRFVPRDRAAARARLGLDPDEFIVLAVGRLVPLKGFLDAIEAVALLDGSTRLVLVGDGPQRDALAEEAARRAPGRVVVRGAVGRSELAGWYAAADCVVVPSVEGEGGADTGPVVLVEALASGRPVVSTRVGIAPRLILSGVNGYLVPEHRPTEIAESLVRVRAARGGMDDAARTSFVHHGGWERYARDLVERYEVEAGRLAVQPM